MRAGPPPFQLMTDGSEPMAALLRDLKQVAPSRLPVLLQGPTGSGKEVAARDVHRLSARKGPLVAVNCAAFAEGTLESELFGHVRGAFTGAHRDRAGAVEEAEGGTLFLDEVADLSPRLQSMLLRVLQEREVRRVGGGSQRTVDVRFVAATNRPLEALAAAGQFRRDLLFRLQGAELVLPSLQERRHEFPYLVPRLAAEVAAQAGLEAPRLAEDLPRALARHPWPGNFRQLRHALERALWRCAGERLGLAHFRELEGTPERAASWVEATLAFQRKLLAATLERHGHQVAATARALGLARGSLYPLARRLGVELDPLQTWTGVREARLSDTE